MILSYGARRAAAALGIIALMLGTGGVEILRQRTADFEWKAALIALQIVLTIALLASMIAFIVTLWADQARSAASAAQAVRRALRRTDYDKR